MAKYRNYKIYLKLRKRGIRYYPHGRKTIPILSVMAKSKRQARGKISAYPYRIKKIV